MPTIHRTGPYRFFFFSNESTEPPHVHVQRERKLAKFWLTPVRLAASSGFRGPELRTLTRLMQQHSDSFVEAWNEYFSEPG